MNFLLAWLDLAPDPVSVGVGAVVILLIIVMALAVVFTAGLVFFLIWRKRRKIKDSL